MSLLGCVSPQFSLHRCARGLQGSLLHCLLLRHQAILRPSSRAGLMTPMCLLHLKSHYRPFFYDYYLTLPALPWLHANICDRIVQLVPVLPLFFNRSKSQGLTWVFIKLKMQWCPANHQPSIQHLHLLMKHFPSSPKSFYSLKKTKKI